MRLSEILSPVTLSDFRNLYYQTKAFYVAGAETKLSSIFDWSALSELLNTLELPNPNLRLVKEGRRIGYDDHRSLLNACRDGATLILDGLHKYNKEACWLAQEISGAISEPSQINLYLSQPGMGGFNVHYDTHDVLILQLSGKKNWEVFPSTINQPLFYQKEHGKEAPTEPYLVETLHEGDVLYVPKGHWHRATAVDEVSMHLTVGILARTGVDFLNWLVDELRDVEEVRQPYPLVLQEESGPRGDGLAELAWLEMIKSALCEALGNSELLRRYRESYAIREARYRPFSLPAQLSSEPVSKGLARSFRKPPFPPMIIRVLEDRIRVISTGRTLDFHKKASDVLEFIREATTFSVEDTLTEAGDLSREGVFAVLDVLVSESVLEVTEMMTPRLPSAS